MGLNVSSLGKALRLVGVVSTDLRSSTGACEYNVTRAPVDVRPQSTAAALPASPSAASHVIDGGFVDSGSDSDEDDGAPGARGGRPPGVRAGGVNLPVGAFSSSLIWQARAFHPTSTFLHVSAADTAQKYVFPAGGFAEVVRVLEEAGYRRCCSPYERGTPRSIIQALLHPGFEMAPASLGKVLRLLGVTSTGQQWSSGSRVREYGVTRAA